jgi:hypothetical protein
MRRHPSCFVHSRGPLSGEGGAIFGGSLDFIHYFLPGQISFTADKTDPDFF